MSFLFFYYRIFPECFRSARKTCRLSLPPLTPLHHPGTHHHKYQWTPDKGMKSLHKCRSAFDDEKPIHRSQKGYQHKGPMMPPGPRPAMKFQTPWKRLLKVHHPLPHSRQLSKRPAPSPEFPLERSEVYLWPESG